MLAPTKFESSQPDSATVPVPNNPLKVLAVRSQITEFPACVSHKFLSIRPHPPEQSSDRFVGNK